jgi:hypothetical protein
VSARTGLLFPGARLLLDGEIVVVTELDGSRVTVRGETGGRYTAVGLGELVARARPAGDGGDDPGYLPELAAAGLTPDKLNRAAARAGHVREVLTGYRSSHPGSAREGEPRPEYQASQPMVSRYRVKAAQLGVTARTVENWVAAYRDGGQAGLAGPRQPGPGAARVDLRWDDAVRAVLAGLVNASTPTRSAVLMRR